MRDFCCCGSTLPSLHDLLQHYEEHHAQQMPSSLQKRNSSQMITPPDSKAAIAAGAAAAVQERAQQERQKAEALASGQVSAVPSRSSTPVTPRNSQHQSLRNTMAESTATHLPPTHDMDAVQDMEMDDDPMPSTTNTLSQYSMQPQPRMIQRSQFGQPPSARLPPLDLDGLNMGNPVPHQGLRKSQPTTPVAAGRRGNMYQNNPTVSSVNTPTLTTHPLQQQQYRNTPDSSAPGTPIELGSEFVGDYEMLSMGNSPPNMMQSQYQAFGVYGFRNGNPNEMHNLCIDDPAKRLFSLDGGLNNPQQSSSSKLGDALYTEDSEIARTIRESQRRAGVPDPQLDGSVPKPFHCPVIGCEKAYKNQNGLKYHKSVRRPLCYLFRILPSPSLPT